MKSKLYAVSRMNVLLKKNSLLWSSAVCDHEFGFLRLTSDSLVFESNEHVPRKVIPFSSILNTHAGGILRRRLTVVVKGVEQKIVFTVPETAIWKKNLALINPRPEYIKEKSKLNGEAGILSIVDNSLVFQKIEGKEKKVIRIDSIDSVRPKGILKSTLTVRSGNVEYAFKVSKADQWAEILSFAIQMKHPTSRKAQVTPQVSQNTQTKTTNPITSTINPGQQKSNFNQPSPATHRKLNLGTRSGTISTTGSRMKPVTSHVQSTASTRQPIAHGITKTGAPAATPRSNKTISAGQYRGSWPMGQDYDQAFQNVAKSINPTLGNSSAWNVIRNPRNQSMLVYAAGNFGSVYKVKFDDGKIYALKCFTKKSTEINMRYEKISNYLETNSGNREFLVHFKYFKDGIKTKKSDTFYFPILKMEWCEGQSLNNFVESNLNRPKKIKLVAETLVKDIASLQDIGISHGDLSGDNIIINDKNEIFFVDYDGMFIPGFKGTKSVEIGHGDFQHPNRTREDYSEKLDNFSTLIIYTSLLAVSEKPSLWSDFNDDNPDRLIFGKNDFKSLENSKVYAEIMKIKDQKTKKLLNLMKEALSKPVLWDGDNPNTLLSM
ncbi:MAG: hypothetical protein LVQ96_00875 [Thermoplasmatales archaeon]|nr:hypothetical protein [Thermoplasmatales archaeon]MCW6169709.1 hypothetical protein [Thermoplasmatales archaeon]